MKYSLIQLLSNEKGDVVSGPMSPILFAQAMANHMEHPPYNLVVRVRFDQEHCFQEFETGEGWTSYDTLVLGLIGTKSAYVGLWVDAGYGLPVAMRALDDDEATFSPIYSEHRLKPNWLFPDDDTIQNLLKEVLDRRNEFAL